MPRVETVLQTQNETPIPFPPPPEPVAVPAGKSVFTIPANEIVIPAEHRLSRPGPLPPNEQKKIDAFAQSIREVGQIEPIKVRWDAGGELWHLVAGGRRVLAMRSIRPDYPVEAIEDFGDVPARRIAIHENIHRRNYTPLQFATLCRDLQLENGWTGTKELSEYIGVSRAQISQHLKLLTKPVDMPQETYEDLLARLNSGVIGADTAFFALTQIKEKELPAVVQRATENAIAEALAEPATESEPPPTGLAPTNQTQKLSPAVGKGSKSGEKKPAVKRDAKSTTANVPEPEWMRKQREASKQRKLEKVKAGSLTVAQLKAAAKELDAIKTPAARSLSDLSTLVSKKLATPAYPDPMRNFLTFLVAEWLPGEADDDAVVQRWKEIAIMVEDSTRRNAKIAPHKPAATKATKTTTKKKSRK